MSFEVEQLANNAQTTLNGGINSSVTTLTLASASSFPTSGVFRILIGTEILKVTAVSGTTLTVARGSEGTTPASHSSGDAVTAIQTAASVRALMLDASGHPPYAYPFLADFAFVNQGGAAADDDDRGIYLTGPASAADSLRILKQAAPSTPYTLTTKVVPNLPQPAQFLLVGIGFRENATGKLSTLSLASGSGSDAFLSREHWNNPTSFNATPSSVNTPYRAWITQPWLRLRHDGTNLYFDYSSDGYKFYTLGSEAKASFFTTDADELFFYCNANHASLAAAARLLSWAKT